MRHAVNRFAGLFATSACVVSFFTLTSTAQAETDSSFSTDPLYTKSVFAPVNTTEQVSVPTYDEGGMVSITIPLGNAPMPLSDPNVISALPDVTPDTVSISWPSSTSSNYFQYGSMEVYDQEATYVKAYYTPTTESASLSDAITFSETDTATNVSKTVTHTLQFANSTPLAVDDYVTDNPAYGLDPVDVYPLTNDHTKGQNTPLANFPYTVSVTSPPSHGKVTVLHDTQASSGLPDSADNSRWHFSYKLTDSSFTGTDSFSYSVSDVDGQSSVATVHVATASEYAFMQAVPDAYYASTQLQKSSTYWALQSPAALQFTIPVDGSTLRYLDSGESVSAISAVGGPVPNFTYNSDTNIYTVNASLNSLASQPLSDNWYITYQITSSLGTKTGVLHIDFSAPAKNRLPLNLAPDSDTSQIFLSAGWVNPGSTWSLNLCDAKYVDSANYPCNSANLDTISLPADPQYALKHGTASINGTTISYTATSPGQDVLYFLLNASPITVSNGLPASNMVAVYVDVPRGDRPMAVDDNVTIVNKRTLDINPLANDTGLSNSVKVSSDFAGGPGDLAHTITSANHILLYTSAADPTTPFEFTYRITDSKGQWSEATITVTTQTGVIPNSPPVLQTGTVSLKPHAATLISLLHNATDPDGDSVSFVNVVSPPKHGVLQDCSAGYTSGLCTYANLGDGALSDSFTYQVRDAQGALSNVGTENINILDTRAATSIYLSSPSTSTGAFFQQNYTVNGLLSSLSRGVGGKTISLVDANNKALAKLTTASNGYFTAVVSGAAARPIKAIYDPTVYDPQYFASSASLNVKLLKDTTSPAVSLLLPAAAHRTYAAYWKSVSGVATDSKGTGVASAYVRMVQHRGKYWYAYRSGKWTLASSQSAAYSLAVSLLPKVASNGHFTASYFYGLSKNCAIYVYYTAKDKAGNYTWHVYGQSLLH